MARLAKIIANDKKPKFQVRHRNRCENCGRPRASLECLNCAECASEPYL